MRKLLLVAGMVAATALPAVSSAQTSCEQARHDKRVTGTVLGAIGGAVLGGLVSGNRGHKESGALLGGVGGAVVGNQLSKGGPCPDGQVPHDPNAYYDHAGNYHTSFVDHDGYRHSGFYDRGGAWHADYAANGDMSRGWRDRDGRWCHMEDRSYRSDNGEMVRQQVQECR